MGGFCTLNILRTAGRVKEFEGMVLKVKSSPIYLQQIRKIRYLLELELVKTLSF